MEEVRQGGAHVVIVTGVSSSKSASYADLEALPAEVVGEIVGGVLHASPRPSARHALASSVLGAELSGPFQNGKEGPGGWWILDEPELHLGEDVLVPDLAGWRRLRLPEIPDEAFFTLPPDWVCEVLSPATAKLDLAEKLPRYAAAGVEHAWVIDPANRLLLVFELRGKKPLPSATFAGEDRVRALPFAEVEIPLGRLWGGD